MVGESTHGPAPATRPTEAAGTLAKGTISLSELPELLHYAGNLEEMFGGKEELKAFIDAV